MMTTEELKRLRELCEKATKGEWYEDCGCVEDSCGMATIATCGHGGIVIDQYRADARFIAAARTALPALLDEVERLRKALKAIADKQPRDGCQCCTFMNMVATDAEAVCE